VLKDWVYYHLHVATANLEFLEEADCLLFSQSSGQRQLNHCQRLRFWKSCLDLSSQGEIVMYVLRQHSCTLDVAEAEHEDEITAWKLFFHDQEALDGAAASIYEPVICAYSRRAETFGFDLDNCRRHWTDARDFCIKEMSKFTEAPEILRFFYEDASSYLEELGG
jgi:hypothetical protein